MNWRYLVPRLVLVLLIWGAFAFAFDPLLRRGLVGSAQQVAGARVDVAGLSTSFISPSLLLEDVQIANRTAPDRNLLQFDELNVRLAARPLLSKSFVIEEGTIRGLTWNTPRTESGELDDGQSGWSALDWDLAAGTESWGRAAVEQVLRLAGSQLDPRQLESVQLAEQLHRDWTARFDEYEVRLRNIESRVKTLQSQHKQSPTRPLDQIDAYARGAEEVHRLLAEAQRLREDLAELPRIAQIDFERLDAARQRDLARLERKLDLLQLDGAALSEALLGPELAGRLRQATEWIGQARALAARLEDDAEPPRMRGLNLSFARPGAWPEFLVRRLHVDGKGRLDGNEFLFSGILHDVSSQPSRHDKPIVLELEGQSDDKVRLVATLDYTGEQPLHGIEIRYSAPRQRQFELGDASGLGIAVTAGRTEWHAAVTLQENRLDGRLRFLQSPVKVAAQVAGADDDLSVLLQRALGGIAEIEAVAVVAGSLDHPQVRIESNLGPEIARSFGGILTDEIETRRIELAAQLETHLHRQTLALRTLMSDRYGGLMGELRSNESAARSLIERVAGGQPLDLGRALRVLR